MLMLMPMAGAGLFAMKMGLMALSMALVLHRIFGTVHPGGDALKCLLTALVLGVPNFALGRLRPVGAASGLLESRRSSRASRCSCVGQWLVDSALDRQLRDRLRQVPIANFSCELVRSVTPASGWPSPEDADQSVVGQSAMGSLAGPGEGPVQSRLLDTAQPG
jgi:hypothetical protein